MPWWGWLIVAFVAVAVICALIKALKDLAGEIILTVLLWVVAFPIMLVIKLVQHSKRKKKDKSKR